MRDHYKNVREARVRTKPYSPSHSHLLGGLHDDSMNAS